MDSFKMSELARVLPKSLPLDNRRLASWRDVQHKFAHAVAKSVQAAARIGARRHSDLCALLSESVLLPESAGF